MRFLCCFVPFHKGSEHEPRQYCELCGIHPEEILNLHFLFFFVSLQYSQTDFVCPTIDEQLWLISFHITWSSEEDSPLISGVTRAQWPLRSPRWNVGIAVVGGFFGFTLSCGWWKKTQSRCVGNQWSPAHASKCCKEPRGLLHCCTKAGLGQKSAVCVTAFQGNRRTSTDANVKCAFRRRQLFYKAVEMFFLPINSSSNKKISLLIIPEIVSHKLQD